MFDEYNNDMSVGGISKDNRKMLDVVNRQFSGPFEVSDVEKLFNRERTKTIRLLAHWASKGWLTRIRRGLYSTVPLGAKNPKTRSEDPWIVANKIFYPCYVGGWSACEHWGLTEQIFDSIVIFTSQKVRHSKSIIQGTAFLLKPLKEKYFFGLKIIWQENTKIQFSNPSRTIVDILNDPSVGGGMRHVNDVVKEYFAGEHKNEKELMEYIKKLGNRAVYKRLGYLIEINKLDAPILLEVCKNNVSAGFSLLDPTVTDRGHHIRKWNLRINVNLIEGMVNNKPQGNQKADMSVKFHGIIIERLPYQMEDNMLKLEVILEPAEEGGYTITCPMLKGCVSEGETKKEALANIQDAIKLYLRAVKKEEEILVHQHKGSELLTVSVHE